MRLSLKRLKRLRLNPILLQKSQIKILIHPASILGDSKVRIFNAGISFEEFPEEEKIIPEGSVEQPNLSIIHETKSNLEGDASINQHIGQAYIGSPQLNIRASIKGEESPEYAVSQLMTSILKNSAAHSPEEKQTISKSKGRSNKRIKKVHQKRILTNLTTAKREAKRTIFIFREESSE